MLDTIWPMSRLSRSFDVQVAATDVIDGFVVDHECAVGVLEGRVGGENGVVRFDHGGRHLRCGIDGEFEFGFLAVVDREALHEERGEAGAGPSAEAVENEKSLQAGTLVGQLADPIQDKVHNFFANGVVTTGVIVGGIFLSCDQLFRVKQLSVRSSTNFI
uniref:Uncharacterized protein n=1 Tax=Strigamia maritima TaxID=126957 RepID=T1JJL6_STRMM